MGDSRRLLTAALVVSIALAGVAALVHATRWGPGITPDSTVYIAAARGLLDGRGFSTPDWGSDEFRPVTRFPPLYSAALAAPGLFGVDPLETARGLGGLLLVCNTVLVALGLWRATRGAVLPTLLGTALFNCSASMLKIHGTALSEPLFLSLGFSGVLALVAHLEEPRSFRLVLAAACTALALLTRFAGAAFVISGIGILLLVGARNRGRRIWEAVIFATIASSPFLLWILRNRATGASSTGRTFSFHPVSNENMDLVLETMGEWMVATGPVAWILGLGVIVGVVWGLRPREAPRRLEPFAAVLLAFAVAYPAFLWVSLTFFDAHIRLNPRILSPLLMTLLLLVPYGLARAARGIEPRAGAALFAGLGLLLVGLHAHAGMRWVGTASEHGLEGFSTRAWHESELLPYLAGLAEDVVIYSNGPDALYFHVGRKARYLPMRQNPGSRQRDPHFGPAIEELGRELRARGGVVAWFDRIAWRWYRASLCDLRRQMPLRRIEKLSDGSVWVHANAPGRPDEP